MVQLTALRNEGKWPTRIKKLGVNMQSLKKRGKYAVESWNEGSYADYPKIYLNTYLGFIT